MRTSTGYESLELQNTHLANRIISQDSLVYNRAPGTKRACIAALIFNTLIGIGFLILGGAAKGRDKTYTLNAVALELVPLAINVLVLIVTETNGYIHAVSLRWALFYESKLEFNTNLRLLTFSKTNMANGVAANIIFFITIVICYAASPMILIRNTYVFYLNGGGDFSGATHLVSISKVTPIALGLAILVQCALSTWCLMASRIATWSSNPLTTLTAVTTSGQLVRQKGRCMMSSHDRKLPTAPMTPRMRQPPPYSASKLVLRVMLAVAIVWAALIVWSGIIIYVAKDNGYDGSWNFIPTATVDPGTNGGDFDDSMTTTIFLNFFANHDGGSGPKYVPEGNVLGILFLCVAIQSFLTVGLHCAELQVTLLRDELVWRSLSSPTGSQPETVYNSITAPLKMIPNVVLLVFKPVVHWLFGTALGVDYAKGLLMRVPHITYLMVLWFLFFGFVTVVSFLRPKGPLPVTYGHLQTMLDVADECADVMYWGDKGLTDLDDPGSSKYRNDNLEVRHSGTSSSPLPPVVMGTLYS